MSFKVTVYFNNEYIDSTEITTPDGNTYTGYYGDVAYTAEAPMYNFITVKANPARGYKFSHWVYRYVVDGVQTEQMYYRGAKYKQISYDGSNGDLIIRAVGKEGIPYWDWDDTNGAADEEQTRKAHDTLLRKGPTKDFSYKVWNDMVSKVNTIIKEIGEEWDTGDDYEYESYTGTRMTPSGDKTLTAKKYNSLIYNINRWHDTGLNEVSPGDEVKASYFLTLADGINDFIDEYEDFT